MDSHSWAMPQWNGMEWIGLAPGIQFNSIQVKSEAAVGPNSQMGAHITKEYPSMIHPHEVVVKERGIIPPNILISNQYLTNVDY